VLSICSHNNKALFFVVTIYKVRESGVEKEVEFYVPLQQIRVFNELALFVFLPIYLLAVLLYGITFVDAKGVVVDNDHKFSCVLAENKLESSICLPFLLLTLFYDREIKGKVKKHFNSFNPKLLVTIVALFYVLEILMHLEL